MSMSILGKNDDLFWLIIKKTLIFTTIHTIQGTHTQKYVWVTTPTTPSDDSTPLLCTSLLTEASNHFFWTMLIFDQITFWSC